MIEYLIFSIIVLIGIFYAWVVTGTYPAKPKVSITEPEHPSRAAAINILEYIADRMGDEEMFDGPLWLELEDEITSIIENK